jgi:putative transposase
MAGRFWYIFFCTISIGNVIQYINNQEQHHQKRAFKDEYLELLKKFEITFDENYLFEWIE